MRRSHMMCVAVLLSRQTWWRIQNLKVTKNFSYPTRRSKIIVTVNMTLICLQPGVRKRKLDFNDIHILSNPGVTHYVMLHLSLVTRCDTLPYASFIAGNQV